MTRYISLKFFFKCSEIVYVCSVSSNYTTKTWYLDYKKWLTSKKILNSQPWSRPTRQRSAAHQWAAAHRLRTAALAGHCYNHSRSALIVSPCNRRHQIVRNLFPDVHGCSKQVLCLRSAFLRLGKLCCLLSSDITLFIYDKWAISEHVTKIIRWVGIVD